MTLREMLPLIDEPVQVGVLNDYGFIVWADLDYYRGIPVLEMEVFSIEIRHDNIAIIVKAPF